MMYSGWVDVEDADLEVEVMPRVLEEDEVVQFHSNDLRNGITVDRQVKVDVSDTKD